jgi:stage V sporulation protein SpoVS
MELLNASVNSNPKSVAAALAVILRGNIVTEINRVKAVFTRFFIFK